MVNDKEKTNEGGLLAKQVKKNWPCVEAQWKPGQSGNPAGTPKSKSKVWWYVCKYEHYTEEELKAVRDDPEAKSSQLIAIKIIDKMIAGEWQQAKEVIERSEGKVPQTVNVNTGTDYQQLTDMTPEQLANKRKALLDGLAKVSAHKKLEGE